jgi:hypothetical protein
VHHFPRLREFARGSIRSLGDVRWWRSGNGAESQEGFWYTAISPDFRGVTGLIEGSLASDLYAALQHFRISAKGGKSPRTPRCRFRMPCLNSGRTAMRPFQLAKTLVVHQGFGKPCPAHSNFDKRATAFSRKTLAAPPAPQWHRSGTAVAPQWHRSGTAVAPQYMHLRLLNAPAPIK